MSKRTTPPEETNGSAATATVPTPRKKRETKPITVECIVPAQVIFDVPDDGDTEPAIPMEVCRSFSEYPTIEAAHKAIASGPAGNKYRIIRVIGTAERQKVEEVKTVFS